MPNRIIKESIRESESIDKLSPEAECTWYRLITYVDDYGLFKAHARLINKALYPLKNYTDEKVAKHLEEISQAGMVGFYLGEDGKPYGVVLNWTLYNKPRNSKPKFEAPTDNTTIYNSFFNFENFCNQLHANENKCPRSSSRSSEKGVVSRTRAGASTSGPPKNKNSGKFPPPTLEEVKQYCLEHGYPKDLAERVYKYYEANKDPTTGNWLDSKNNVVKAWKQKMQAIWFKPENKKQSNITHLNRRTRENLQACEEFINGADE